MRTHSKLLQAVCISCIYITLYFFIINLWCLKYNNIIYTLLHARANITQNHTNNIEDVLESLKIFY